MVWGGIHSPGKTALVVLNGTLNTQDNVDEVIQHEVMPYIQGHGLTFQQDNAHPHTARLTQEFLRANAVHTLPWPVYLPDLSPIEHLWDLIDRRIRSHDRSPQTVPQLRLAIQEAWDDIPLARIAHLMASMPWKCRAVHEARGGYTRY